MDFSHIIREKVMPPDVFTYGRTLDHPLRPNIPRIDIVTEDLFVTEEGIVSLLKNHLRNFELNGNGEIQYLGRPILGMIYSEAYGVKISSVIPNEDIVKNLGMTEEGARQYMSNLGNRMRSILTNRPEDLEIL